MQNQFTSDIDWGKLCNSQNECNHFLNEFFFFVRLVDFNLKFKMVITGSELALSSSGVFDLINLNENLILKNGMMCICKSATHNLFLVSTMCIIAQPIATTTTIFSLFFFVPNNRIQLSDLRYHNVDHQ